jgi:hypothetical protein
MSYVKLLEYSEYEVDVDPRMCDASVAMNLLDPVR